MYSRLWTLIALSLIMLSAACRPAEPAPTSVAFRGAIVPTRSTPVPTETLTPSDTPSPTETPTLTETPSPTETATDVNSPTPTHTATEVNSPTPSDTPTLEVTLTDAPTLTPTRSTSANAPQGEVIVMGQEVNGEIDDANVRLYYLFAGEADQVISIRLEQQDGDLDPLLILLDPDGREIARNDDRGRSNFDSALSNFTLPTTGIYTIITTRYAMEFGPTSGGFELEVLEDEIDDVDDPVLAQPIEYGARVSETISNRTFQYFYTFVGTAGDRLRFAMEITDGDLQGQIVLHTARGQEVFRSFSSLFTDVPNWDIGGIILPETGFYTLTVQRRRGIFGESTGDFRFEFELEEAGTAESPQVRYAVFNENNSTTLVGDDGYYLGIAAGDLNISRNELSAQFLITYLLPPLPENATVQSATLDLSDCTLYGDPFDELGTLRVYTDPFGAIDFEGSSDTDPGRRAEELDRLSECGSVDITAIVSEAYQDEEPVVQFRGLFNRIERNELNDIITIQPRLIITLQ